MNALISGYDESAVVRTHAQRLAAMPARSRLPEDPRTPMSRDTRRASAALSRSFVVVDAATAKRVFQLRMVAGFRGACQQLGVSTVTLTKIVVGHRMVRRLHSQVLDALQRPATDLRKVRSERPSESVSARVREFVREVGSLSSASELLHVARHTVQKVVNGDAVAIGMAQQIEAMLDVPRPEGWKTGKERKVEGQRKFKAVRNARVQNCMTRQVAA